MKSTWRISRRTVLRGVAASVSLPLLEVMSPAVARAGASAPKPPLRFACVFQPNGVYPPAWDPKGSGTTYEFSPILEPLAPFREDILLVSNLGTSAKGHVAATSATLTGTPLQVEVNDPAFIPKMGISLDQFMAQKLGHLTRLPSIELGIEPPHSGGENNLPISFASTVSWSADSTKVDPEINPRAAFDRLFSSSRKMREEAAENKYLVDRILEESRRLMRKVSTADQRKLDEYLTSVHDVEKRINQTLSPRQRSGWTPKSRPALVRPEEGVPDGADVHIRIMMDLLVMALQTDSTRVATLMMGHGFSRQSFPWLDGVKGDHHFISHYGRNEAELTVSYTKISRWFSSQYAYLLQKMKAIDEGGSTLLDNSILLYACELRDGNAHTTKNLPMILAGHGGKIRPGRYLLLPEDTPLANLHLTIAQRMGIETDRFNTSTGVISDL